MTTKQDRAIKLAEKYACSSHLVWDIEDIAFCLYVHLQDHVRGKSESEHTFECKECEKVLKRYEDYSKVSE